MNIRLSAIEARIIGALMEKQVTTPDQYPLSLNALVNACNQKSNREPLMQVDEATVKFVVDSLARRHFIVEKSGFGSRVPKYQQIFCNTEFGSLKFTPLETGVVCELLVRGPQTPGELRNRVTRMADLPESTTIESILESLAKRPDGAIVAQLPRESGRRDSRWAQTFEELPDVVAATDSDSSSAPAASTRGVAAARIAELEREVAILRAELERLKNPQP
jgi:uncharacterized protein YceH (UPF0502 family)